MGVWGISEESIAYIRSLSDKLEQTADELKASAAALLSDFEQNERGLGRHSANIRALIEVLCAVSNSDKVIHDLSEKLRMSAKIRALHREHVLPMRFSRRVGGIHGTAHSVVSANDIGASFSQADVGDGVAGSKFHSIRTIIIPVSLDSLPDNVQSSCQNYQSINWSGNYPGQTPGTSAGKIFDNDEDILPVTHPSGVLIEYKEFDVNNKIPGKDRDALRFLKGSDGSLYYTDNHYLTFYKIDDGDQQ